MNIYSILGKLIMLSVTQPVHHSKQWVNIWKNKEGTGAYSFIYSQCFAAQILKRFINKSQKNTYIQTHTKQKQQTPKLYIIAKWMEFLLAFARSQVHISVQRQTSLWSCLLPPYKCPNSLPTKAQPLLPILFPIQYSLTSLTHTG
jgi:hypothetical protein